MNFIGEKLKSWRQSRKISGYQIEKLTSGLITRANLSSFEKGRWGFSDELLGVLASVPGLDLDLTTLKNWQTISKNKDVFYNSMVGSGSV